ncbi:MAG TPA: hypothetical protein PLZ86_08060 [bacterium]|nr:hypothetical protein [bacterium]
MVDTWLLAPPIAFVIVLVAMLAELWGLKAFSSGVKAPKEPGGRFKAYACGEDVKDHRAQPDYSQFFPFAFFFTIMHVVALIIATVPRGTIPSMGVAFFYLAASAIGLYILFRR